MAVYQLGDPFVEDVVSKNGNINRRRFAVYECECGNLLVGRVDMVPVSCGCVRKVRQSEAAKRRPPNSFKHGMIKSLAYNTWGSMIQRCHNPKDDAYPNYGGRGIEVYESWMVFTNFYHDMGDRPRGTTIDRIDVNGNYCKDNCRWATWTEQMRNKRNNVRLTVCGETKTVPEWAECFGAAKIRTIHNRLRLGWSAENAIFGRNSGE